MALTRQQVASRFVVDARLGVGPAGGAEPHAPPPGQGVGGMSRASADDNTLPLSLRAQPILSHDPPGVAGAIG